jgi:hypothetical protein
MFHKNIIFLLTRPSRECNLFNKCSTYLSKQLAHTVRSDEFQESTLKRHFRTMFLMLLNNTSENSQSRFFWEKLDKKTN